MLGGPVRVFGGFYIVQRRVREHSHRLAQLRRVWRLLRSGCCGRRRRLRSRQVRLSV